MGEDGGPVVVASRSALPSKRGSSLPWVRGAGRAERVRCAIVGAGAGSTWGVKKLGRIGGGGTRGAPAVPTDVVSGGGGMGRGDRDRIRGELGEGRGGGWIGEEDRGERDRDSEVG